jgi:hypothetical protein
MAAIEGHGNGNFGLRASQVRRRDGPGHALANARRRVGDDRTALQNP